MEDFANQLRSIVANGEPRVGIAAGVDKNLIEGEKLCIPKYKKTEAQANPEMKKTSKVTFERGSKITNIDNTSNNPTTPSDSNPNEELTLNDREEQVRRNLECSLSHYARDSNVMRYRMCLSAIYAVHFFGLIDPDSTDVRVVSANGPHVHTETPTNDEIIRAATMIFATKVNWFQTNHHTGQSGLSGYPLKIYKTLYSSDRDIDDTPSHDMVQAIHKIGHWASTHLVLTNLEVNGIKKIRSLPRIVAVRLADDMVLRKSMHPSGVAALSIAYNCLKRYVNHPVSRADANIARYEPVVIAYHEMTKERARYHVASKLLTGSEKIEYDDSVYHGYLGILGCFISVLFPKSTLAASPKINSPRGPVYTEYDDYSSNFDALCKAYRKHMIEGSDVDITAIIPQAIGDVKSNNDAIIAFKEKFGLN